MIKWSNTGYAETVVHLHDFQSGDVVIWKLSYVICVLVWRSDKMMSAEFQNGPAFQKKDGEKGERP